VVNGSGHRASIIKPSGKLLGVSQNVRLGSGTLMHEGKKRIGFCVIDPEIGHERIYLLTKAEALMHADALRAHAAMVDE